jgi:hypothetical protein
MPAAVFHIVMSGELCGELRGEQARFSPTRDETNATRRPVERERG